MLDRLRRLKNNIAVRFRCGPPRPAPTRQFGSQYGGWRVIPPPRGAIVYSFGVGNDITFDLDIARECGAEVHLFDPTPKAVTWIADQQLPPAMTFNAIGLSDHDGTSVFYLPNDESHVSGSMSRHATLKMAPITVPMKRLATFMRERGHSDLDLLKLDIEGSEYAVLEDAFAHGIRPRQIAVEFHHRFREVGWRKTDHAIRLLRGLGYVLVYRSSTTEEFTFAAQTLLSKRADT